MTLPAPVPPPLQEAAREVSGRTPAAWRFSLRSLLSAITAFALWCGIVSILPTAFSQILVGIAWIAAAGWLVTGIFFAAGDQRAFCIGAVVVVSTMWTGIGGRFMAGIFEVAGLFSGGFDFSRPLKLWLDLVVIAGAAVANGYLCILARRYFQRHP